MDCPVFVVVVRMSWQGWALSVSTLLEGALVSNVSKSSRKSQTATNQLEYQDTPLIIKKLVLTTITLLNSELTVGC